MAFLDKLPKSINTLPAQQSASKESSVHRGLAWTVGVVAVILLLGIMIFAWYWSIEPDQFNVEDVAMERVNIKVPEELAVGYTYSSTISHIVDTLLDKHGGYISNDVGIPGILLDNITNWEYGALVVVRDASSALRNHFARSQSQSREDSDLAKAEPLFYFDNSSWQLPSTEGEYQKGNKYLLRFMRRLADTESSNARVYARADNLRQYLEVVEKRLGDISYRLSASIHNKVIDLNPSGGRSSTVIPIERTAWLEVDDIFYEARGATWALLHIFKAIRHDFKDILQRKNAANTVQNIINELEAAQEPVLSPMVLNGSGFGIFANYSLTMANHIARANAATLDLRDVLMRG